MTQARSELVDLASTVFYHCFSRCVRRAFLCGQDDYSGKNFEHRKEWVETRLLELSGIFAIEIYAFAVMSNHLHLVLRVHAELARTWDDDEVVERYACLFRNAKLSVKELSPRARREVVEKWRERLCDLSWFMRALNEHIARRANKEDECTGRFWEGRFKSKPLLDEKALLTCMAYVDMNPIRSGEAQTLDDAAHTSIGRRLQQAELALEDPGVDIVPDGLVAFDDQVSRDFDGHTVEMNFVDYVKVLEWTRRCARAYGPGARLRGRPPALLTKLRLDPGAWLRTMEHQGLRTVAVLGSVDALHEFAAARGKKWVHGKGHARRRAA